MPEQAGWHERLSFAAVALSNGSSLNQQMRQLDALIEPQREELLEANILRCPDERITERMINDFSILIGIATTDNEKLQSAAQESVRRLCCIADLVTEHMTYNDELGDLVQLCYDTQHMPHMNQDPFAAPASHGKQSHS